MGSNFILLYRMGLCGGSLFYLYLRRASIHACLYSSLFVIFNSLFFLFIWQQKIEELTTSFKSVDLSAVASIEQPEVGDKVKK